MNRDRDRQLINELPKDLIPDFIFLHLRDLWAVDGLYFLGIEESYGTEAATEIDRKVWEVMGKIEARRLRKLLGLQGKDIATTISLLEYSSWAMDLEDKEIIVEKHRAIIRNKTCRVQNTRLKKNLREFPCKKVRWGFLKSFAEEINPYIQVRCNICPPDKHPSNLWCEWEFQLKE